MTDAAKRRLNRAQEKGGEMYTAREDWYLTTKGDAVMEGNPRAFVLLVRRGEQIPADLAEELELPRTKAARAAGQALEAKRNEPQRAG